MEFLYWYALFAMTTSLAAMYELVLPVLSLEKDLNGKVESVYLYYIIFTAIFLLTAPAVFLMTVVPSFGETFRKTLHKSLFPMV